MAPGGSGEGRTSFALRVKGGHPLLEGVWGRFGEKARLAEDGQAVAPGDAGGGLGVVVRFRLRTMLL
mgnify:FL=1